MTELILTTPEALTELIGDVLRRFQAEHGESPQTDWMTTKEAAQYLRVTPNSVYQMVSEKSIPVSKMKGSNRFSRAALDRWLLDGV